MAEGREPTRLRPHPASFDLGDSAPQAPLVAYAREAMARRLVLISTSTVFGTRYLEHAYAELRDALGGVARVLFIPHALRDHDGYVAKARPGVRGDRATGSTRCTRLADPRRAVEAAEAVFCGGGNTFRLLDGSRRAGRPADHPPAGGGGHALHGGERRLEPRLPDDPHHERHADRRAAARSTRLGLVSFQINPHYLDPTPDSTPHGRDARDPDPRVPRGERARRSWACARARSCGSRRTPSS